MKKIFRKNQVIITALALMIAVAGYVSYTQANTKDKTVETAADELADTYEISDEDMLADIFTDTEDDSLTFAGENPGEEVALSDTQEDQIAENDQQGEQADAQTDEESDADTDDTANTGSTDAGETLLTSAEVSAVDFSSEVKLNREQVRGKNREALMEIIDSTSISDAQKQDAVTAMIEMTDVAERENAAELLLEAKGFTDVVVSVTDNSADVVLNMGDVTDAKRAQVEDIVKRKTGIAAENIVITPISTESGQK